MIDAQETTVSPKDIRQRLKMALINWEREGVPLRSLVREIETFGLAWSPEMDAKGYCDKLDNQDCMPMDFPEELKGFYRDEEEEWTHDLQCTLTSEWYFHEHWATRAWTRFIGAAPVYCSDRGRAKLVSPRSDDDDDVDADRMLASAAPASAASSASVPHKAPQPRRSKA
jgi:hypothetical protein